METPNPFAISTKAAAKRYSVSARTLSAWRAAGMPFLVPGPRKILFVVADADRWVAEKFAIGRPRPTLARLAQAARAAGGAA